MTMSVTDTCNRRACAVGRRVTTGLILTANLLSVGRMPRIIHVSE